MSRWRRGTWSPGWVRVTVTDGVRDHKDLAIPHTAQTDSLIGPVQEELGALAIVMNGPRFWLIDSVTLFSELGETRFFGELEMRLLASVALSPSDLTQSPYTERSVVRDTEFVFLAGREVCELVAPGGEVYVMQSYAHIIDDTLNEAALPSLGERLALPEGWSCRTRVLDEDYVVVDQDGIATVVQDELQNTYQLAGLVE